MSTTDTTVEPSDLRDQAEERERRITQITRKEIKRPELAAQARERSLEAAFDNQGLLTEHELRAMTHPYDAPVISLYLDFGPVEGSHRTPVVSIFHSLEHDELDARRELLALLPGRARQILDLDLREIRMFLESFKPDRARSLVLFKSGDEVIRIVTPGERMRDRLVIDLDPYLEPLEGLLASQHMVLVVHVEKDAAQFSVHHLGRAHEVDSIRASFPTETVDRSRPGTVQRRRLTHEHWHLREVTSVAVRLAGAYRCDTLVLAGVETQVAELQDMLPQALRAKVIGVVRPSPGWSRRDWESAVEAILSQRRRVEEAEAMSDLPLLASRGRVVSGLPAVLEALNEFLVRDLYVSDSLSQTGFVCREHHFLALQGGSCPFDGSTLLAAEDVIDEAIEIARSHGVNVLVVQQRQDLLEPYSGITAVTYAAAPS